MKIFIKQAKVLVPESAWSGETCDVVVENGIIKEIGENLKAPKDAIIVEHKDLHLSLGWFDFRAHYCDPGMEYKEDLWNGLDSASRGGFTGVAILPSTDPVIDSKADIQYLLNKSAAHAVEVFPYGSITRGMKGEELAEMYDMQQAGAVAFTDDKQPLLRTDLVKLALQYADNINSLILTHPEDRHLGAGGLMNEGPVSTHNALKGMPNISEEMAIARNIQLCEYTEGRLHISTVSTKEGVELIRQAKGKGLSVTADVAAYHLFFNDEALSSYDSNLKVNPPIRSEEDRKALINGVLDGTIDIISSDHRPEDVENKTCEFSIAAFGMISQETFLGMLRDLPLEKCISHFTSKPREILGLDIPMFEKDAMANLTLFAPSVKWTCQAVELQAKSKNTPLIGKEMQGKVLGTLNGPSTDLF